MRAGFTNVDFRLARRFLGIFFFFSAEREEPRFSLGAEHVYVYIYMYVHVTGRKNELDRYLTQKHASHDTSHRRFLSFVRVRL